MEKTFTKRTISGEMAAKMIEAVIAKAKSLGVPQIVSILDESGLLKAFHRMDGAPLISIEVSQNKAYTALLGAPSQDFFNRIKRIRHCSQEFRTYRGSSLSVGACRSKSMA